MSYFAHEPVLLTLPGGGYVIYKIGCGDGALTGSEGTALVGPCTGCSNGTTEGLCPVVPSPTSSFAKMCFTRTAWRDLGLERT